MGHDFVSHIHIYQLLQLNMYVCMSGSYINEISFKNILCIFRWLCVYF